MAQKQRARRDFCWGLMYQLFGRIVALLYGGFDKSTTEDCQKSPVVLIRIIIRVPLHLSPERSLVLFFIPAHKTPDIIKQSSAHVPQSSISITTDQILISNLVKEAIDALQQSHQIDKNQTIHCPKYCHIRTRRLLTPILFYFKVRSNV